MCAPTILIAVLQFKFQAMPWILSNTRRSSTQPPASLTYFPGIESFSHFKGAGSEGERPARAKFRRAVEDPTAAEPKARSGAPGMHLNYPAFQGSNCKPFLDLLCWV